MPETKESTAHFIRDVANWPLWPRLPVKRRHEGLYQVGVVLAGSLSTVYLASVYDALSYETPCKKYQSIEKMLDDGWIVD